MHHLAQLEESQWWSHEQLEEIQSRRLQRLIRHAHANVPYYRPLMDEHTTGRLAAPERPQWWSQERVEELQSEKLRLLIEHAFRMVPHSR